MGVAHGTLHDNVHDHVGYLRGPGGRELVTITRSRHRDYIVAALMPRELGHPSDHEDLTPFGITVPADPVRAADAVVRRLLPRYADAHHRVLSREIAAFTPTMAELAGDRPRTAEGATEDPGPPETADQFRGSNWLTNPTDTALVRKAALELLSALELRFIDELRLADALSGGGEYICETHELAPALAPVIEAEALLRILNTAGMRGRTLSDPGIPALVRAFDAQSTAVQRTIVEHASRNATPPESVLRSVASAVRSPRAESLSSYNAGTSSPPSTPPATRSPSVRR